MDKTKAFGEDRMKIEVKKLQKVNQAAKEKCQIEYVPKLSLPIKQRPYGSGVLGYKIHGIDEHPECLWMVIDEPKFVDILRKLQNERAFQIMKNKNNLSL